MGLSRNWRNLLVVQEERPADSVVRDEWLPKLLKTDLWPPTGNDRGLLLPRSRPRGWILPSGLAEENQFSGQRVTRRLQAEKIDTAGHT